MRTFNDSLQYFYRWGLIIILGVLFLQCGSAVKKYDVEPPVSDKVIHESIERNDLFLKDSPKGLRVVQITVNQNRNSHNVYTEAQVFTPDSKKFVIWRSRENDPSRSDVWICDVEDNFGLRQITDEKGIVNRPVTSLDGNWVYYTVLGKNQNSELTFTLKRVSLKDYTRETLFEFEGRIPGTNYKLSRYSLRAISSDCKRLCAQGFLGDGKTENAPFGIMVFDIEKRSLKVLENPVFKGQHFNNMHLQYCPSLDPDLSHDILI